MSRHSSIIHGSFKDGETEADNGSLSKRIVDICNGKTIQGLAAAKYGRQLIIVLIYDDV
jgi:hypothetical protein